MNEIMRLHKNIKKLQKMGLIDIVFENLNNDADDSDNNDTSLSYFNESIEGEIEYQNKGFCD